MCPSESKRIHAKPATGDSFSSIEYTLRDPCKRQDPDIMPSNTIASASPTATNSRQPSARKRNAHADLAPKGIEAQQESRMRPQFGHILWSVKPQIAHPVLLFCHNLNQSPLFAGLHKTHASHCWLALCTIHDEHSKPTMIYAPAYRKFIPHRMPPYYIIRQAKSIGCVQETNVT